MSETSKKWNDEQVAKLMAAVGDESPVSVATVEKAAAELGVTTRSVASKLRQMDVEVASMAKERTSSFTKEETDALAKFVNDNAGLLTYREIAEQFPGEFSAKQIQGKLLALELTDKVKPAEKVEVALKYSAAEEETFISMANAGKFLEDIAAALGKTVQSVRGKALSLTRAERLENIPKQRESHAKESTDPVTALGAAIATMTVAEIATATDKTERGIKTLLTRRGIKVADYDGVAKKAKAQAEKTDA